MGTNYNIDTNELIPNMIKGEYFVDDLINPDAQFKNARGSQMLRTSIGRDLSVRGVFWSYNNPPTVKEVNAAVKKMKDFYSDLLERQQVLDKEDMRKAYPNITPEHHAAAEYFKVVTPWHKGKQVHP